eukprot:13660813-Ditylum_brightwellii.AAC.1
MKGTQQHTLCTKMNSEELSSQIEIMLMQECGAYACQDYLGMDFTKRLSRQDIWRKHASHALKISAPIDAECRFKMSRWCYQVVDHCGFDRESVSVAMSYLDRFLATDVGITALIDRKTFQLVVMTTLYTAVKLLEKERMNPSFVTAVSGGTFTEKDITDTEIAILYALDWRIHPPTALAFTRYFLSLIPSKYASDTLKNFIVEVSRLQVELAVTNYSFVTTRPSTIAIASILNTMDFMDEKCLPDGLRRTIVRILERNLPIDLWTEEVYE